MVALNTGSDIRRSLVAAQRFSYAYPGAPDWVLRDITMRIHAGECHLLEGPTGSGKTTLLMAIRGLLPPGRQAGSIRLAPPGSGGDTALPGLLLQNPKTQLLCSSLGADVAFGLENHRVDPAVMPDNVQQALNTVGLGQPLDRSVDALSMGQQYRACLAGLLVMGPCLVMLDEPMAQLDPGGQARLLSIIHNLKQSGRAVLICEHRPQALVSVSDRAWQLDPRGSIRETTGKRPAPVPMSTVSKTPGKAPAVLPGTPTPGCQPSVGDLEDTLVLVDGLKFNDANGGGLDLSALSFCVSRGERIAIYGSNGTGKTTLVNCLSGLRRPMSGKVQVFGQSPQLKDLRGRMRILFQDPRRQLFETTVFEEVAFSARRGGLSTAQVKAAVDHILGQLQLSHLSQASPHKLSYGQKHLVGLAAVLVGRPEMVLLDDPFAGLDADRTGLVMQQLAAIADAWGTTIIWTTHDPQAVAGWADRVIHLPTPVAHGLMKATDGVDSATPTATKTGARRWNLGTGAMLSLCLLFSMLAFAARSPALLAVLSGVNLLLLGIACPRPWTLLRKSLGLFFWQAAMVILLYLIRFGIIDGIAPGFQVSWQLFLALWPGMIFMASNTQPRINRSLSRFLPHRTAFVVATCLRFLPMLLAEMKQIRATQTLRGARLLAGDLKTPRFWPDWIHCLLVPALIKTLSLAGDIATAATARDFGIQPERTAWPGE